MLTAYTYMYTMAAIFYERKLNQLHTILMYMLCACCVPRTSMTLWLRLLTFDAPHIFTRLDFVLYFWRVCSVANMLKTTKKTCYRTFSHLHWSILWKAVRSVLCMFWSHKVTAVTLCYVWCFDAVDVKKYRYIIYYVYDCSDTCTTLIITNLKF
jgi:hypothetical protein